MTKPTNIGLYLTNSSNKNHILDQILANRFLQGILDLGSMRGALYSMITINRFIEEELRHDRYLIQTTENSSLGSMSSGQQKKALLMYQIAQKPEFRVLDDVYSNVDKETQQIITDTLGQLAETTLLIQVFFRKRDLLPCIQTVISIDENNKIVHEQDAGTFLAEQHSQEAKAHLFSLPTGYDEQHQDINQLVQLNSVSVKYLEKQVVENIN